MRILFTGAHRIFFPAAGLLALGAIPFWLVIYVFDMAVGPDDMLAWHIHEMLFGYLGAALAGFLFTAIPNWTGRPAFSAATLAGLFALWLAGRLAMFALEPGTFQSVLTLAFGTVVAMLATREIVLGGNARNLPVAGMTWGFVVAQGLFLFGDGSLGSRAGFGLGAMMIALIGGRVTPAFSRNWLRANGKAGTIPAFGALDKVALVLSAATVVAWIATPAAVLTGGLALLTAIFVMVRLLRWKGWLVISEPLLIGMHVAYLWLPVAFGLLGISILIGTIETVQVYHAFGAGAVATMTIIVMIRAILGHGNRPIKGDAYDVVLLILVHIAAVVRVLSAGADNATFYYSLAGGFWALGFLMFVARYTKISLQPRL